MADSHLLWNRLEIRARCEKFDDNLRNTLHDPYWTLCRQWQTGEFEASDNGSPAEVRVRWRHYPFQDLSLGGNPSGLFTDRQPLEAEVERTIIRPGMALRIEMGRHFQRMLKAALGGAAAGLVAELKANPALRFELPAQGDPAERQANAHLLSNRTLQTWVHAAAQTGALDGGKLYDALKSGQSVSDFLSGANAQADATGAEWVVWFDNQYNQPANENVDAWLPRRLEYQFEVSLEGKDRQPVVLGAEEYYEGRLDWYAFAYGDAPDAPPQENKTAEVRHLIPAQVAYPGMPAARWWEMEDAKVNLLAVETSATQSGRLALMEFGLMYSNDWFILPLRAPVGSLLEVAELEVRSVFGVWTRLDHYKKNAESDDWTFFGIAGPAPREADKQYLLIPPSVVDLKESKAIEEVYLARDEMANMVWGIESQIPDGVDRTREGNAASLDLATYLQNLSDEVTGGAEPAPLLPNAAKVQYKLATQVPEYWIPFMPVQMPDSDRAIWLQRAAMPRVYPGLPIERVRPRTTLLRRGLDGDDWQPYFIFEEEAPKSGVRITRTWQRARWYQGRVALWSGYRKQNGRGQGNSGLRFDALFEKGGGEE